MTILQRSRTTVARAVLGDDGYRRALRILNDRRQRPRVGKVRFGDLRRVEPICREYGYARGRPVDRYYVESFLAAHGDLITGNVLEIGERTYTETFGNSVTRSDMLHVDDVTDATYVADLTDAPQVPSNTYDCIIMTQTLQFIYDTKAALRTIYRILKPGGVLLCTAPGISQIGDPVWNSTWYWSFTELSARRLFGSVFPPGAVDVRTFGNVLAATSFLQGISDRELRRSELDVIDPEYPVIVTMVARTADAGQRRSVAGGNGTSPVSQELPSEQPGMDFLRDVSDDIAIWDSRAGVLPDGEVDADCLYVSKVLEHHWDWRRILGDAVRSFGKRMVLVISIPLGDSELRLDDEQPTPVLQLPREELLSHLAGMTVHEELVDTPGGTGTTTVLHVEK
ncbi:methyltransferase domain-containing protein [Gordonia sp. PKS22-38]|uniref:Methyltransferase domain-containing protein n=1 Tax=Gordonia prachuapensis TaxID=3115651 RepID=A0ABU7MYA2_9ACTN|nr:methyltransferase domain-containing protein [Gordonia sp. PKS22-38]